MANNYVVLAEDIKKVVSSLKSLSGSSSAFSDIASGISEVLGLGSELTKTVDLIVSGFTGAGGVTTLVGFGISSLIKLATEMSKQAEEAREAYINDFNTGKNSLSREDRGYSFDSDVQDVVEMVQKAKEGHIPMDSSSMDNGARLSEMLKYGTRTGLSIEDYMKDIGLAYEYQYQLYLKELDGAIQAAQKSKDDALNAFTPNGMSENGDDGEAAKAYEESIEKASAQLREDVSNAQKAYNIQMMELTHGILKELDFTMDEEMQKSMDKLKQAYKENNPFTATAVWEFINSLNGTDAGRVFQGLNDNRYFEALGITDENKSLYGNRWGFGGRSATELAGMLLSFLGGVDPNADQYGNVEGKYKYNSAAETVETPQVKETAQTGAINYQEITSPEDFANLYGSISEDSEAYAGLSSSVAAILPQVFSSEDFGASLTAAMTTAFASEDLWGTLGETINSGFATMVEGQLETFTEYGTSLGEAMTAGVAQGIDSGTARVCTSIRNMAFRAVAEAKKSLDINSPSRVFRQIGLSTGEGFALGIDESLLLAENAAMRMSEGVARAGAGMNAVGGRGTVVNLNVNQPSIRSDDDVRRLSEEFARYTAAMTYGL